MKTKTLRSFSSPIIHNGIEYTVCPATNIDEVGGRRQAEGFKCLKVVISLHPNLKGATDLCGNSYKPSQFLFVSTIKAGSMITKEQIKRWLPSLSGHQYFIETILMGKEYVLTLYGAYNFDYLCSKADVQHIGTINERKYSIKPL